MRSWMLVVLISFCLAQLDSFEFESSASEDSEAGVSAVGIFKFPDKLHDMKVDYCKQTLGFGDAGTGALVTYTMDEDMAKKMCKFIDKGKGGDSGTRFVIPCFRAGPPSNRRRRRRGSKQIEAACTAARSFPYQCIIKDHSGKCKAGETFPSRPETRDFDVGPDCSADAGADNSLTPIANVLRKNIYDVAFNTNMSPPHAWNALHTFSFYANPNTIGKIMMNYMNKYTGCYWCPMCKKHFTDELTGFSPITKECLTNPILCLWELHNRAEWEIGSGDEKYHPFQSYFPTLTQCSKCRNSGGWDYKEVQRFLYVYYRQTKNKNYGCANMRRRSKHYKSACTKSRRRSSCKWNNKWNVCVSRTSAKESSRLLSMSDFSSSFMESFDLADE